MNEITPKQDGHTRHVLGFVDLLRSCAAWPESPRAASETDQYLANRRSLPLPDGAINVDRAQLARGGGDCQVPGDEFVLVVDGDLRLEQPGARCDLRAGEAAVVIRGRPLTWRSENGASLIVMRCAAGGGAGANALVRIDLDAPLSPSNPPAPEVLVGATPQCRNHTDYRSASGEFVCGVWDSTPYHRRTIDFRHYELMRLLEGAVTFVDRDGHEGRFRAGDVVLIQQGGAASWESREHVRKIYATYRPAT